MVGARPKLSRARSLRLKPPLPSRWLINHVGNVGVVFGEVVRIHVNDDVLSSDGKIDIPKIKPIARMGYYNHCVVENVFEMKIPGGGAAADGLEGKA